MRPAVIVSALVVLAAVWAAPALANVRKVSFTSSVRANDTAKLIVVVSPRSRCTIKVVYGTTVSHAPGLGAKTGGRISWSWKVDSSRRGSWPVTVTCGGMSGELTLRLRIR